LKTPQQTPVSPAPPDKPALPRDLLRFLIQFSVSLNKSRSYPPGHPVLEAALDILFSHLQALLQRVPVLTVGITRERLVLDGVPADEGHPVLRELAEKLHRHQLAAIQFRPGVDIEELGSLVSAIGVERWRQGKPLGLEPLEQLLGRWPHVALEPLPLDQLELGEDLGPSRQSERIWQGLLNAAMLLAQDSASGSGTGGGSGPVTPERVAAAIRARRGDAAYDTAVVDWMVQMGEQLEQGEAGAPVRQQVEALFGALDPETLQRVIELGASPQQRRKLLLGGSRTLPVRAVLDLVHAAGSTPQRNPSHALMRILGKLASHAESARGPVVLGAEEVVRDSVRQLVGDWDLEDPSTREHRQLLELLAQPGRNPRGSAGGRGSLEAMRMLQMGLELGAGAAALEMPLRELSQTTPFAVLADLLAQAEGAGLDAGPLWIAITRPAYLSGRLLEEDAELPLLERILDRLGAPAVEPLLDALEQAESSSRRRWLMTRLESHREGLGAHLVARLPGKPWFVVRNLLTLLGSQPALPEGFAPDRYTEHEDARVRREAYKLQFAHTAWRSGAILHGVSDADPQVVRMALMAAQSDCPVELPVRLFELLRDRLRDPADRAVAIRLVGRRPSPAVRDWLITQVSVLRGFAWFRSRKLTTKSPDMLAALGVLASHFASHPEVARLLSLARQSRDPEIVAAVRPGKVP
jgi:hypothetical protein